MTRDIIGVYNMTYAVTSDQWSFPWEGFVITGKKGRAGVYVCVHYAYERVLRENHFFILWDRTVQGGA